MPTTPDFPIQTPNEDPKETRRTLIFLLLALMFLIISASVGGFIFASSAGLKPGNIISKIRSLTLAREKTLQGEQNDRVNILLLGMGGAGHDGATLTDTMIFASLRPSDGNVGMLSIPRDLQILLANKEYSRVNAVNAFAELKQPGSGGQSTADVISGILQQPINYYLRLDFKAFEEIIDAVGGIDVKIEQSFYDPFYPDENFGYEPVSFTAGAEHMNGERALKFVRSRHGTNGEGNDFARARRQQKVLFALKERLLSFNILLHPKRIKSILESLTDNIQTNISFWEGMRLGKILRNIKTEQIISRVLDSAPDGVLRERNYNGAFVLEPKDETWGAIRTIAENLLDPAFTLPLSLSTPSPQPSPTKVGEGDVVESPLPQNEGIDKKSPLPLGEGEGEGTLPLVEIQNGTFVAGLASKTATKLEPQGFDVVSLGNATTRDVKTTIVYDLTGGTKTSEFEKLLTELKAIKGEGEPLHILSKGKLDFLIILGEDNKY